MLDLARRGHDFDCLYLLEKRGSFVVEMPLEKLDYISLEDHVNPEFFKALVDSINTLGVIHPIIVLKMGNQYWVQNGVARVLACEHLGLKTIKAEITV
jgi:ParB-like chromosome segregation protein Spo0J